MEISASMMVVQACCLVQQQQGHLWVLEILALQAGANKGTSLAYWWYKAWRLCRQNGRQDLNNLLQYLQRQVSGFTEAAFTPVASKKVLPAQHVPNLVLHLSGTF